MNCAVKQTNRSLLTMLVLAGIVGSAMLGARHSAKGPIKSTPISERQAAETYGRIPLSFEANRGQTESSVDYLARGAGYTLFLKPDEAVFALRHSDCTAGEEALWTERLLTDETNAAATRGSAPCNQQSKVLRMKLVGANRTVAANGVDELPGKANYFTGSDPALWRHDIPTYARVSYREVYPGVDVVYYGNQRQMEYDFVVAPGRDPRSVNLQFEGADKVEVNATGELVLTLGTRVIQQPKPVVYQEVAGERRAITGGYSVSADGRVGFGLGPYDTSLPLVIDPVLVYSTYLGGSDTDEANDIAVDSSGNAYICGVTNSTNFPTANAIQGTFSPPIDPTLVSRDGFVTKLNVAGTAVVYSTYLGGNRDDFCSKIAVDASGNAYVAGEAGSSNFPTANAIQSTYGGGFKDAFIAKINPAGSALVYSTYLGGTIFDAAQAITIDAANNVYITGRSTSSDYPVVNPIQAAYTGGPGADVIVTKINAAGTAIVYSTYLGGNGGNGFEAGFSIKVDSTGNAYITGETSSTNFPTANAIQSTFGGGFPDGDAFVTKINAAGSALVYSTYLGGSDNDLGFEIAVDSAGSAYVTGVARSTNFPTANAFQSTLKGTSDAFVTKLNPAGTAFVYSTYLGGTSDDSGNAIALDSAGNTYVAGGTSSTDFPLVNPTQGTMAGVFDNFVTKLNLAGSALTYSTYFGGSGGDTVLAIAVDSANSMYLTGRTASTNYPTLTPFQSTNGGGSTDAFVTKISDPPPATVQFSQAVFSITEECAEAIVTLTRAGNISSAMTVDFVTSDGTALQRTDYTIGAGTVRWAAGDGTTKSLRVLITEDAYVEGSENLTLTLSNPTGGGLGSQVAATLTILDDDSTNPPTTNPIDDPNIFVRQHYHDMLAREGDAPGIAYWTNEITACGGNATCVRLRRLGVSDAFFFEAEYQDTAAYLYRVYKVSFHAFPSYTPFMRDRSRLVGSAMLDADKNAFNEAFVLRPAFIAAFPLSMTAAQYVDALNTNTGNSLTTAQRDALVNGLLASTETRGTVLRKVAENSVFIDKEYNNAFVVNLYFGYLRRDPESGGFTFWLGEINKFPLRSPSGQQAIVCSFLTSQEYQERFSSTVTRTNAECGP